MRQSVDGRGLRVNGKEQVFGNHDRGNGEHRDEHEVHHLAGSSSERVQDGCLHSELSEDAAAPTEIESALHNVKLGSLQFRVQRHGPETELEGLLVKPCASLQILHPLGDGLHRGVAVEVEDIGVLCVFLLAALGEASSHRHLFKVVLAYVGQPPRLRVAGDAAILATYEAFIFARQGPICDERFQLIIWKLTVWVRAVVVCVRIAPEVLRVLLLALLLRTPGHFHYDGTLNLVVLLDGAPLLYWQWLVEVVRLLEHQGDEFRVYEVPDLRNVMHAVEAIVLHGGVLILVWLASQGYPERDLDQVRVGHVLMQGDSGGVEGEEENGHWQHEAAAPSPVIPVDH
mmetsp:Transcript_62044/g.134607  ORF Transcript_62044/g.134607 Transcript_62044/m.134607 type:complete len:343 (+) Transcript_62044:1388-2416(+)